MAQKLRQQTFIIQTKPVHKVLDNNGFTIRTIDLKVTNCIKKGENLNNIYQYLTDSGVRFLE